MTAGHALRWRCPECGVRLRAMAQNLDTAEEALVSIVREHLATVHAAPGVNAVAQASWLDGAGRRAELWGGPHDGDTLWVPSGGLPDGIAVERTPHGGVVPHRLAGGRVRDTATAAVYRLDRDAPGLRYRWRADG